MRRSSVLVPIAVLLLAGCKPKTIEQGFAESCIGTNTGAEQPLPNAESGGWTIEGVVVADQDYASATGVRQNLIDCFTEPSRVLEIEDLGGGSWWIAYTASDPEGIDITAPMDVTPNDEIAVRYRFVRDIAEGTGFTVRDASDDLVAALEVGTAGPALVASDTPEFEVSLGDQLVLERSSCGARISHELVFETEFDRVRIDPGEQAPVLIDEQHALTATAIAGNEWLNASACGLFAGAVIWSAWR